MNSNMQSKINYTGLVIALAGIAVTTGWIPEENKDDVIQVVTIGGGALIVFFRSFWTEHESFMKRKWKEWVG